VQFGGTAATAQGTLKILLADKYSRSLYSIGDLYFLYFLLIFRQKQL
jgi:hypothetical protein